MCNYLPIELAPKDGTRILLCHAGWENSDCICYWEKSSEEWYRFGEGFEYKRPTHFAYLPVIPEK